MISDCHLSPCSLKKFNIKKKRQMSEEAKGAGGCGRLKIVFGQTEADSDPAKERKLKKRGKKNHKTLKVFPVQVDSFKSSWV